MLAQHSQKTTTHYTPKPLCDDAHKLMGNIDLDPCGDRFSDYCVNSKDFYPASGLQLEWWGRVLVNAPGQQQKWWDYLLGEYRANRVAEGFFIGYTNAIANQRNEILRFPHVFPRKRIAFWCHEYSKDFVDGIRRELSKGENWKSYTEDEQRQLVETRRRFLVLEKLAKGKGVNTPDGALVEQSSPTHYNVLVYLPPKDPTVWRKKANDFRVIFGKYGDAITPEFTLSLVKSPCIAQKNCSPDPKVPTLTPF